jgi:D-sedoheptulose 7-phosphate isomerase
MPIFSAIANDYGYEHVFTLQLKTMMERGDVVVAISASGNSPNVVRALQYANENGAITVSLTGFDGGELKRIAQVNVHVPSDKGEYGPVEDVHMVLDHLVGAFLMHLCRTETVART